MKIRSWVIVISLFYFERWIAFVCFTSAVLCEMIVFIAISGFSRTGNQKSTLRAIINCLENRFSVE